MDAPAENFTLILKEWRKKCKDPEHVEEVKEFMKKELSDW